MARWHRVGVLTRSRGVVYEADQPLTDHNKHKILPGELHTVEKINIETATTSVRGTWPLCRRQCKPFIDAEVRYDSPGKTPA